MRSYIDERRRYHGAPKTLDEGQKKRSTEEWIQTREKRMKHNTEIRTLDTSFQKEASTWKKNDHIGRPPTAGFPCSRILVQNAISSHPEGYSTSYDVDIMVKNPYNVHFFRLDVPFAQGDYPNHGDTGLEDYPAFNKYGGDRRSSISSSDSSRDGGLGNIQSGDVGHYDWLPSPDGGNFGFGVGHSPIQTNAMENIVKRPKCHSSEQIPLSSMFNCFQINQSSMIEDTQYPCKSCGKAFYTRQALYGHLKIHEEKQRISSLENIRKISKKTGITNTAVTTTTTNSNNNTITTIIPTTTTTVVTTINSKSKNNNNNITTTAAAATTTTTTTATATTAAAADATTTTAATTMTATNNNSNSNNTNTATASSTKTTTITGSFTTGVLATNNKSNNNTNAATVTTTTTTKIVGFTTTTLQNPDTKVITTTSSIPKPAIAIFTSTKFPETTSITSPTKSFETTSITSPIKAFETTSITSPTKSFETTSITSPIKAFETTSITSPTKSFETTSITPPTKYLKSTCIIPLPTNFCTGPMKVIPFSPSQIVPAVPPLPPSIPTPPSFPSTITGQNFSEEKLPSFTSFMNYISLNSSKFQTKEIYNPQGGLQWY
eukprot:TRINITY_DN6526_c0_g1_i1.p1 TRINITY_DN6526_c0_g1~~TRINITY_DN6526_c0_g1_i1.p1  ORF type:complete len:605 (-),score=169.38 TRINITY_DN6526_c0_g1_i1:106-1920(-)